MNAWLYMSDPKLVPIADGAVAFCDVRWYLLPSVFFVCGAVGAGPGTGPSLLMDSDAIGSSSTSSCSSFRKEPWTASSAICLICLSSALGVRLISVLITDKRSPALSASNHRAIATLSRRNLLSSSDVCSGMEGRPERGLATLSAFDIPRVGTSLTNWLSMSKRHGLPARVETSTTLLSSVALRILVWKCLEKSVSSTSWIAWSLIRLGHEN